MPSTRIRASVAVLAATALAASGALAGCTITRADDSSRAGAEARSTPSPTDTGDPSSQPSASTSSSTLPSPSASVPSASVSGGTAPTATSTAPAAALLSAAEMPQLNSTSRWTERRTGPAGSRSFGLCQKFDLLSIGAMTAVERTFTHGTDTAGQQVADFPDAQNAVRASKVLEAWQRDCAKRVRGTAVKVRPITDVAVPRGTGWHYLVSFKRGGTGHFHAFGVALSGTRLSVLRMDHDGQDHNYEPGQDPMELAVKAVSARLG